MLLESVADLRASLGNLLEKEVQESDVKSDGKDVPKFQHELPFGED